MGKKRREFAVYLRETDELVAFGTSEECARGMGISAWGFYNSRGRQRYRVVELPTVDRDSLALATRPPRRDCFGYRDGACRVLKETYCLWEACRFFKPKPSGEGQRHQPGRPPAENKKGDVKMDKVFCVSQCGMSGRCDDHVSQARQAVKTMDDLGARCFYHRAPGAGDRVKFEQMEGQSSDTAANKTCSGTQTKGTQGEPCLGHAEQACLSESGAAARLDRDEELSMGALSGVKGPPGEPGVPPAASGDDNGQPVGEVEAKPKPRRASKKAAAAENEGESASAGADDRPCEACGADGAEASAGDGAADGQGAEADANGDPLPAGVNA